ncbi:MAG TPA: T9SS type A sorting domain-containing protein [Candidatus Krumholzibacteria bacterium]|nr:T9SS type A sorting domain-containing protein [Candidatus Krumholzibacteria bacterium]
MSVHFRRQLAPACVVACCLVTLVFAPRADASALQRLAATIDFSHIAASGVAGSGAAALLDEMTLALPARTALPASVELLGATTEVRIGLPHEADMDIEVTDESGAVVCSAQVHMPAGWQKLCFSGRAHDGSALPNGVYFYRVAVGDEIMVTRVVINR